MATAKQKKAARHNLEAARAAQQSHPRRSSHKGSTGLSTAKKNDLTGEQFAFPSARKEPLTDAAHVRNAVARFDQVEGVTDRERDEAWGRITRAAERFGVELIESDWRDLAKGGRDS